LEETAKIAISLAQDLLLSKLKVAEQVAQALAQEPVGNPVDLVEAVKAGLM